MSKGLKSMDYFANYKHRDEQRQRVRAFKMSGLNYL
jgi:hypothetical protein